MPKLLSLVVCTAVLTWLMLLVASLIRARAWTPKGLMLAFGNRADLPEATQLAGRDQRAASNTLEDFVLFASLALTAQLAGATGERVLMGAEVFLWARIAYIPVYLLGVPFLRTAVWAVGVVGMGLMIAGMR